MESGEIWMRQALALAQEAGRHGEVPVGAVLVSGEGVLLGTGFNHPIAANDPTAHAEIVALRMAARTQQNYRLPGSTLYVTIEPCTMCVGALIHARVAKVIFGAPEPRSRSAPFMFLTLTGTSLKSPSSGRKRRRETAAAGNP